MQKLIADHTPARLTPRKQVRQLRDWTGRTRRPFAVTVTARRAGARRHAVIDSPLAGENPRIRVLGTSERDETLGSRRRPEASILAARGGGAGGLIWSGWCRSGRWSMTSGQVRGMRIRRRRSPWFRGCSGGFGGCRRWPAEQSRCARGGRAMSTQSGRMPRAYAGVRHRSRGALDDMAGTEPAWVINWVRPRRHRSCRPVVLGAGGQSRSGGYRAMAPISESQPGSKDCCGRRAPGCVRGSARVVVVYRERDGARMSALCARWPTGNAVRGGGPVRPWAFYRRRGYTVARRGRRIGRARGG